MAYDFYLNGRGFTSRTITVYRDSGRWRAKNDKARQFIPPSDAFSASSPQGEPDRSAAWPHLPDNPENNPDHPETPDSKAFEETGFPMKKTAFHLKSQSLT